MMDEHAATARSQAVTILIGAAATLSLIGAAMTLGRRRPRRRRKSNTALQSYLIDHLTASDAALGLVERLRQAQKGTSVGALADRLRGELGQERRVLVALLHAVGASPRSPKRMAGAAAHAAAQLAAPAPTGDRGVFLALEALAVGVQGKRLLWRALDGRPIDGQWTFRKLEEQALRQWDDLETMRRVFAHGAFDRDRLPAGKDPTSR
jgi:hypothetical protein